MKLRSAKDILAVVKDRGMEVRIEPGPPPMPVLHCPGKAKPSENVTEAILGALRAWRLEIIAEVQRAHP